MRSILIAALLLFSFSAAAEHETATPTITTINAGCLDQELVVALMQETDAERQRALWSAATQAGVCKQFTSPLNVFFHAVVEELVWGVDGEGTIMVVLEVYDLNGVQIFTWAPKKLWVTGALGGGLTGDGGTDQIWEERSGCYPGGGTDFIGGTREGIGDGRGPAPAYYPIYPGGEDGRCGGGSGLGCWPENDDGVGLWIDGGSVLGRPIVYIPTFGGEHGI